MVIDDFVHFPRCDVLESRPPQILIRPIPRIFPFRKQSPFHRLLRTIGFVLFQSVQIIQPPQKQQLRDLLNDFQWIANTPVQKAFQIESTWLLT